MTHVAASPPPQFLKSFQGRAAQLSELMRQNLICKLIFFSLLFPSLCCQIRNKACLGRWAKSCFNLPEPRQIIPTDRPTKHQLNKSGFVASTFLCGSFDNLQQRTKACGPPKQPLKTPPCKRLNAYKITDTFHPLHPFKKKKKI